MSKELYRHILDCLTQRRRLVLATVVSRSGSGPREAGASMAVEDGGESTGTVGGGILEAHVRRAALEVLHSARPVCLNISLTAKEVAAGGMLCGGRMEVLVDLLEGADPCILPVFEHIVTAREEGRPCWLVRSIRREQREQVSVWEKITHETALPVVHSAVRAGLGLMDEDNLAAGSLEMTGMTLAKLKQERRRAEATLIADGDIRYLIQPVVLSGRVIIAGAGHVAGELAALCHFLGYRTVIIDDRREFACRDRFPAAEEILISPAAFHDCFRGMEIDRECGIVIVTRGHEHDRTVLAQALGTGAGYVGMIGSRRKRDAIYRSLRGEGVADEELAAVHCPIGIAIGARTPEEIAVSIAAELIAFRAGKLRLNNQ